MKDVQNSGGIEGVCVVPSGCCPSPLGPPVGRSWQFLELFLSKQIRGCIIHTVLSFASFLVKREASLLRAEGTRAFSHVDTPMCSTQMKLQNIPALQKIDLRALWEHSTTTQGILFIFCPHWLLCPVFELHIKGVLLYFSP